MVAQLLLHLNPQHQLVIIRHPAGDQAKPEVDKPQPGAEADKPQEEKPADGDKPEEKKPGEDKDQKQEGAPEKYEFQAGEGVELDACCSGAVRAYRP